MIVVGKAGAPPRPHTHVGQAGRQQPRRALHLWGQGHQAGQRLLAKGRPSRWECRGSAEARPHTERGSGLLNDRTNWLRPAPPEPRRRQRRAQRQSTFRCLDKTTKVVTGKTFGRSTNFGTTGGVRTTPPLGFVFVPYCSVAFDQCFLQQVLRVLVFLFYCSNHTRRCSPRFS